MLPNNLSYIICHSTPWRSFFTLHNLLIDVRLLFFLGEVYTYAIRSQDVSVWRMTLTLQLTLGQQGSQQDTNQVCKQSFPRKYNNIIRVNKKDGIRTTTGVSNGTTVNVKSNTSTNETATRPHVYRMGLPITNHPPTLPTSPHHHPPHPTTTPNPTTPTHPWRKIGALLPDISWAPPHSLPIQ